MNEEKLLKESEEGFKKPIINKQMKFIIYRTSSKKPFPSCKLEKIKVKLENGKQYSSNRYTIKISTIKQLLELSKKLKEQLVIDGRNFDDSESFPHIEIYDDYRE